MKKLLNALIQIFNSKQDRAYFESRINFLSLTSRGTIKKQAGPKFKRANHKYDPRVLIQREVAFLTRLNGSYVPRLIDVGDDWLEMEYCGVDLSASNLPKDWRDQVRAISKILTDAGIVHRDIKPGNILVKDGRLYLIDFGWAIWINETPFLSPRELISSIPREHIYDNEIALYSLLSSFEKMK